MLDIGLARFVVAGHHVHTLSTERIVAGSWEPVLTEESCSCVEAMNLIAGPTSGDIYEDRSDGTVQWRIGVNYLTTDVKPGDRITVTRNDGAVFPVMIATHVRMTGLPTETVIMASREETAAGDTMLTFVRYDDSDEENIVYVEYGPYACQVTWQQSTDRETPGSLQSTQKGTARLSSTAIVGIGDLIAEIAGGIVTAIHGDQGGMREIELTRDRGSGQS